MKDVPGKSDLQFLGDLLSKSCHGLQAFYDLIESDDNADLCIVFRVLLDRMETDLDEIDKLIVEKFGMVEIEVAEEFIRRDGKVYHKGDLIRVVTEPPKETAEAGPGL